MSSPFLGQISLFAGNFAPRGFAFCNGQIVAISQNTALFALLGTFYGGNGQTTFALPNMQGRLPIHQGVGVNGTQYVIGEQLGTETVTLTTPQIPQHSHNAVGASGAGTSSVPTSNTWAADPSGEVAQFSDVAPNASMAATAIGNAGGGQPHANMQPYLCLNFIIATQGIFPSRN